MNLSVATSAFVLILIATSASAQNEVAPPSNFPITMEEHGSPLGKKSSDAVPEIPLSALQDIGGNLPMAQLAKIAQQRFFEVGARTRSAKDAEIYRAISPSVVLVLTKDALGSGSLIGKSGEVITNYHVVKGYAVVAVVFKPSVEGKAPTRDDMKLGHVVKYDEVADLALIKVSEVPTGRTPVRTRQFK